MLCVKQLNSPAACPPFFQKYSVVAWFVMCKY